VASILILGVKVPFTSGGQEALVRSLQGQLKQRGHQVDLVEIPLQVLPKERLVEQCAVWRSYDFSQWSGQEVDLVIATKFPSYYARAKRKSLWLVHQHRAMYDLYGTRYSDFSDDPRDEALRSMLVDGDNKVLREFQFVSGISKNVIERLQTCNQVAGTTLYPPLPLGSAYYHAQAKPYILSVGRICSIKRVDLIIKALPMIHQFVTLKIVGTPDEPAIMEYLKNEIAKHHLADRIEFLGRVSDEDLLRLYAESLAVYYGPYNEDYGYVTLEAFASSKPVVTCTDSGGVLEFVQHDVQGLISEPTPDALSKAVNRIVEDQAFAAALGQRGRQALEALGLHAHGWDDVIAGLLSPLQTEDSRKEAK
jgi:glycosyltransferase involved in cell wall biosynthesis